MSDWDCDVAIIGGGPAGAAAAIVLAGEGLRATVLEKERFPRFHVGESLLPFQSGILERLGLAEKVAAAGFVPKYGALFVSADGSCESPIDFESCLPAPYRNAWQVERSRFDEMVLRHAEEVGAEVLEEHTVIGSELGEDGCRLRVQGADGGERTLSARWVIDASGQSSMLARKLGLRQQESRLRKVAQFAHFAGGTRGSGHREGDITIVFGDGCWLWHIPLAGGRASVGMVSDHGRWKASKDSAETFFAAAIERTPWLTAALDGAERVTEVHTLANFSYTSNRFAGPGFLLAGDAATFLDPVFSTGVYLAMRSGEEAARVLARRIRSGKPLTTRAFKGYERNLRRWSRGYFRLIRTFYEPQFPALLFNPVEPFRRILTHFLAGRLNPPAHHRAAIVFFYWLMRLNRNQRLVRDPRPSAAALDHS